MYWKNFKNFNVFLTLNISWHLTTTWQFNCNFFSAGAGAVDEAAGAAEEPDDENDLPDDEEEEAVVRGKFSFSKMF